MERIRHELEGRCCRCRDRDDSCGILDHQLRGHELCEIAQRSATQQQTVPLVSTMALTGYNQRE